MSGGDKTGEGLKEEDLMSGDEGIELPPPLNQFEGDAGTDSRSPEVLLAALSLWWMKHSNDDKVFLYDGSLERLMGDRGKPFKKELTHSDVDDNQARVNIRKEFALNSVVPFLRAGESLTDGVPVTGYNSTGDEFQMFFKVWCRKAYVLTQGWKGFVIANGFKSLVGRDIKFHPFRHVDTDKLCFLVYPLPPKERRPNFHGDP